MRKSFIRSLAVMGIAGVMTVNTFGMTFKDVTDKHWAYNSIVYMKEKGYMVTNSKGEFFPNNQVTYFEMAEILAKATGYKDENVVKDMTESEKKAIRDNYTKQKPLLDSYGSKYGTWKKAANEEIAYVVGRGYMEESDLAKFIVKTAAGQEVAQTITREDLAVWLVRVLQKEKTAVDNYKSTGFKDEAQITKDARPHVAYLKEMGVIKPDAKGNFNPKTKVTNAVCAEMTATVLKAKEKENSVDKPADSNSGQTNQETMNVTVNKVVVKDKTTGELYILVEKADKQTTFYSMKKGAKVTDATGKTLTTSDIKVGDQAQIKIVKENGTEYISEMQVKAAGTGNTGNAGNSGNTGDNNVSEATTYTGTVERIGRNGDLTIVTDKGTETYLLATGVTVDHIALGDTVKIQVSDSQITRVDLIAQGSGTTTNTVEMVSFTQKVDGYVLTVKQGTQTKQMNVSKDVLVTRNDRKANMEDLKIGDSLKVVTDKNEVVEISATAEKKTYKGKVQSVLIAKQPQITIETSAGTQTFNVTVNTELYDTNTKDDITIREILIGSQVEILTESKEAVSVVVDRAPSKTTYKGVIEEVGRGGKYIDIVLNYDVESGQTNVLKRVNIPSEVIVTINGKEQSRTMLEEGMEVLVIYNYGDEMTPEQVQVIY